MSATTNGASLEDCLTNIFSLIDLNGLRWKRFKQKDTTTTPNNNYLYTPIDTHPILITYAKCIEENQIAVWRHEPQKRHRGQQPANSLELWIFGYGNQLKVDELIGDDLVEIEDDTWEQRGLSYECRTLLFKALHNLIQKCLNNQGFTKIGRWFVQPQKSSPSYAFNFFVHGDSTICAAVDVRQHPLVQPLTREDLATFQAGGIIRVALAPYGLNGILNGVSYKDSDIGAATINFIQQWTKFYPLPKTMARLVPTNKFNNSGSSAMATPTTNLQPKAQTSDGQGTRSCLSNLTNMLLPSTNKPSLQFDHEPNEVPPVVEVIVAGHRMRYPSECVFTTSKISDPYRTLSHLISPSKSANSNKRPNKTSPLKSSNLSLLSEKLNGDKTDSQTKVKLESDSTKSQSTFNTPFRLDGSNKNSISKNDQSNDCSLNSSDTQQQQHKDRDSDGANNAQNSNLSSASTRLTTIAGFNHQTTLLPTELVKLFPTPPSLEQIVTSPSCNLDDASKEPAPSPANQNLSDNLRDNGIDVYRPVECALMPPPPKWAALSNIIVTKTLPPQCIYKGSPQKTAKELMSRSNELATKKSLSLGLSPKSSNKHLNSLLDKSKGSMTSPSPLADSTNKTGFNMNPSTPKSILSSSILNSPMASSNSVPLFSPSSDNLATVNGGQITCPPSATPISSLTALSSIFTLPHQRLFNNLNEINSIHLNLILTDSVLGMYLDHNFENCTLCVCNMSIKGFLPDTIIHKQESLNHQWKQHPMSSDNISSSSPSLLSQNELTNDCTCGFSAITNRHFSHLSGLFIEDELEITNVLYDPTEMIDQHKLFRKARLSNYTDASIGEEKKVIAARASSKSATDDTSKPLNQDRVVRDEKSSKLSQLASEETKIFVIDQLRQQCSSMIHSNSPLTRVIMIESFRNNRHLTSCINYYAQPNPTNRANSNSPFHKFLDETNKYTRVRMLNRNPNSLKFSDFCEIVKNHMIRLSNQSPQQNTRITGSFVKTHQGTNATNNLSAIFAKMFSPTRQTLMGKPLDHHANARNNNIFTQGLQALVLPTLTHDPKGALQMLEQLLQDESKEALATLNKAILIFSSPMHDWQFLTSPIPENNFDSVSLLKSIQPHLEQAIGLQNKTYKNFVHQQQQDAFSARDSPTGEPTVPTPPCQGPLTWRQFHQAAGRGTEDQCEPQPIPSLLVSHHVDKNHVALSPFALKFWDKLSLEPYAPGHNIFYLALVPNSQSVLGHITTFFKELSNIYDLMKLGKHTPIGNGLITASFIEGENSDDGSDALLSQLGLNDNDPITSGILAQLKSYALQMNQDLANTIIDFIDERLPVYDPFSDRFDSSPTSHDSTKQSSNRLSQAQQHQTHHHQPTTQTANRSFVSLLGNPPQSSGKQTNMSQISLSSGQDGSGPSSIQGGSGGISGSVGNFSMFPGDNNQSSFDASGSLIKSQTLINTSGIHASANEDNTYMEEEATKQSGIVIYIVDPFASPSLTQNQRTLALIGLVKCYSILLELLPENLRRVTQLQLISLDSVINHSRPLTTMSRIDQLKSISMNVYCHCRKILTNQITAKSLTGFGTAAALETFFKSKNPDICVSKMFTPPFILAPLKDKQTELGDMFGDKREKSSVLFCSYCITEDQRWLLASVTNDKGEMSESTVININVVERMKRPKTSVRRNALKKLMDFIISVLSEWVNPWRLIIGKLGRVGHGELKEWASLLSKRSLLNYSRHLTERCRQCLVLPPNETVSILSACLVSLEPDSKLRIMADQFTSDDRQASFNKCPLSTPEDASVTHILVFPTSASIQATHENVEDPLVGSGLDDDLLNQFPLDDGMEDLGVEGGMDDLFSGAWDEPNTANVGGGSHHDTMLSSSNMQMGGSVSGCDQGVTSDETLQLLQQPLALGYYISTAKIGQMPNWFWSTSPHLRNSCPVFLKSALHIHMPCVQLSDDLLHSGMGGRKQTHQLDSNLTTDVLRHVLEGYNSLSWLSLNPKTFDRQSCLPVHMQCLLQLYHLMESFS